METTPTVSSPATSPSSAPAANSDPRLEADATRRGIDDITGAEWNQLAARTPSKWVDAALAYEKWAEKNLPIDDNITPIRQDQQPGITERLKSMAAHPAGKGRGVLDPDRARLAQILDLDLYATRRRQLDAIDEPDDFELAVLEATDELTDVLLAKHKDYGPGNIAGSPGGPLNGLRVRLYDKLARINNLVETGAGPANEPLRDSFLDLANYALIGLLVLDGNWPST